MRGNLAIPFGHGKSNRTSYFGYSYIICLIRKAVKKDLPHLLFPYSQLLHNIVFFSTTQSFPQHSYAANDRPPHSLGHFLTLLTTFLPPYNVMPAKRAGPSLKHTLLAAELTEITTDIISHATAALTFIKALPLVAVKPLLVKRDTLGKELRLRASLTEIVGSMRPSILLTITRLR